VRATGKKWGRPRVSVAIERKVRALRRQDKGIIRIAREAGIGVGTVQRILAPTP
jgi:hypothetical protein